MPARLVEHDHTVLGRTAACKLSEIRQGLIELVVIDLGSNRQKGTSGFGVHETIPVQPLNAMMDRYEGTLSAFGPHTPHKRLQANAMFVFGPQFDGHVGLVLPQRGDEVRERFLKAAWTSGWALAWRGRGCCKR